MKILKKILELIVVLNQKSKKMYIGHDLYYGNHQRCTSIILKKTKVGSEENVSACEITPPTIKIILVKTMIK